MKYTSLFILSALLLPVITTAQTPQSFKYQTVIRDASGQILAEQQVSLRISIVAGDVAGEVEYTESHSVTSTSLGLVALNIGEGTVETGDWTTIAWGSAEHFVRIELDAGGGTDYQLMGTSQLLSVPYALHAQTAENVPRTEGLLQVGLPDGNILYVHPTDNSTSIVWGDLINLPRLDNITSLDAANMDFKGAANTLAIVSALGDFDNGAYAAKLCADLVAFGFDDWYLPAAGELNIMYQQLGPTGSGDIPSWIYWSSSEDVGLNAWTQDFDSGFQGVVAKFVSLRCRCVRR
ncbi:MAG: DUF1566 domain-containing protein [Phaeodactylibacter sp.]|nr:DUF1566 domain-containing protein [Phaeodactylibacter sp.]MCB9049311.1 DUF1566 domain-containing protein [Lewinellaceae bacterium]